MSFPSGNAPLPHRSAGLTFPAPFDALWSYRRRPDTDLNRVKAARAAIVWRANRGFAAAMQAGRYLGWVLRFPRDVVRFLISSGEFAKTRLGRSYSGQVADMIKVATVNGVIPRDYYYGGLARHGGGVELLRYVPFHLFETVATHLSLQRCSTSVALTRDKYAFERRCRELGLPVARTIAIASQDAVRLPTGEAFLGPLPARDLIFKPVDGHQGKGITRWRPDGAGSFVEGEAAVSGDGLLARARSLARAGGSAILIQECLANNPELAPIAGSALATTRVTTILNERDQPEIVEAFYRTSVAPDAVVDNFHAGGVLFTIDIGTERFIPGYSDSRGAPVAIVDHPATGVAMQGRTHPGWAVMANLALRLHRSFPEFVIVGWDIAYTPDGPVVIEANLPPGMTMAKQAAYGGLVGTRYLTLLAFHAGRWLESTEPPGSRWRAEGPVRPQAANPLARPVDGPSSPTAEKTGNP